MTELNETCLKLFTELSKNQAQMTEIVNNHLKHEKEAFDRIVKRVDTLAVRCNELPSIKEKLSIGTWLLGILVVAIIAATVQNIFG